MIAALHAVALGVVLIASHAEATTAWVLWTEHRQHGDPKDRGGQWAIVRAVPTWEACESQLRAEVHRTEEQQRQASGDGGARRPAGGDSGGVVAVTQFYCLPDTVDPRGRSERSDLRAATWLQVAGLVFGLISALLIVLARPATSEVNQMGGRRVLTLRSPLLLYLGLLALALAFVLQGTALICHR